MLSMVGCFDWEFDRAAVLGMLMSRNVRLSTYFYAEKEREIILSFDSQFLSGKWFFRRRY